MAMKLVFFSRIFATSKNFNELSMLVITTFGLITSINEIKYTVNKLPLKFREEVHLEPIK